MNYHLHQLPNGIQILHKPTSSKIAHCCLVINAGARDERQGKDGLAHFIEHLLFKETSRRNTSQILNRLEVVGADLNAYTTKEYTCIHASFLKEHFERSLDLIEDIVFHSTFPQTELEKEKSVILDEIASYQDQPEEAIQDDFEDVIFAGHPLGRNILGKAETLSEFNQQHIQDFIEHNYSTEAMIFAVYGNYDTKYVIRLAEKYLSAISPSKNKTIRRPPDSTSAKEIRQQKPISQTHGVIGCQAYAAKSPSRLGMLLLNNILGGGGMSSRLNLEIREKYGIAYTIESNYTPLSDTGIFSIYFGTDNEKSEKAVRLIHKELKKLREQKLGVLQLHQAKQKFIGQIALAEENRIGLLISMAKNQLDFKAIDSLEEIYAKINRVTAEELLAISNEIFNPTQLTSLLFEPGN
jgi:predicted Zn-dependent peptidase